MRTKILFQFVKKTMIEFNLFKSIPPSQDENVLKKERRQTQIYLILLLTGLVILIIYTSLKPYTTTVMVKSPSLKTFLHLYDQYSTSLNCPCSQLTIKFNEFISYIKPQYHEICVSELISPRWINVEFKKNPMRVFFTNDIRYQSSIHFQLLSTLCHMANQTIEDKLESFYQTKLITKDVLSLSLFQTRIDLVIEEFKRTVPESYQRILQLIQTNSDVNQFIVPMNSKFVYTIDNNGDEIYKLEPATNLLAYSPTCRPSGCSCSYTGTIGECILPTMILRADDVDLISGMFQTWFPLQSVLTSTLECFYNDTCFNLIKRRINLWISPNNFSVLHLSSLSSNDRQYDTIDNLANQLFIQSWMNESSYEVYFNRCNPLTCQYTYQNQFNIIYILTTIIGLLGGLNAVLRLLTPPAVESMSQIWTYVIRRRRQTVVVSVVRSTSVKLGFYDRFHKLIQLIKKNMVELNLFPTIPPSKDEKILRRGRRITRIYLSLLVICLLTLTGYTSLTQETVTIAIKSPSISTYTDLFHEYSSTLQCSCGQVAIKYNQFISQIEPNYHPICSNIFTSSSWLDIFNTYLTQYENKFDTNDFRIYIHTQFEAISKMCLLSKQILNSSIMLWLQTDFITAFVITRDEFNIQINGLIEEFKRKTVNEFMQTFQIIQAINHANQLATKDSSNWQFTASSAYYTSIRNDEFKRLDRKVAEIPLDSLTLPTTYGENNCSCAQESNCLTYSNFPWRISNQILKPTLPLFRIGCLTLDALLLSTFSCLFNQTCVEIMKSMLYYVPSVSFEIFNESQFFSRNVTIEKYLSQLFVIQWFEKISFDLYFDACAPELCQYSYTLKFNQVYFVTTIIALFGGLTKGLHFIIAFVAIIIFKFYDNRKKNRIIPHSQQAKIIFKNSNNDITGGVTIPEIEIIDNPIEEEIKTSKNYTERIIMICCGLMIIVVAIGVSVIWFRNDNIGQVSVITLPTTTVITTNIPIIESTTISINKCYMSLVYTNQTYSIGLGGKSLVVADLNKDSILDLAVTNHDDDTVSILFGNRNGTFQTQQIYPVGNGSRPWGIAIGDFNNDTFLDIAVGLSATHPVVIFFGTSPNGSFTRESYIIDTYLISYGRPNVIEVIDSNEDGFTDILIGIHIDLSLFVPLYVLVNLGDGFHYNTIAIVEYSIANVESMVIGDFDNDGKQDDISVCTFNNLVATVLGFRGSGNALFSDPTAYNTMYTKSQSLIRGRFNYDTLDDLALVSAQSGTLQILLAYGDGTFTQQRYLIGNYPVSIARINFNNDSIDDLAILNCNETISIYVAAHMGVVYRHDISFDIGGTTNNQCFLSLKVADLNQDGKDDLVFIDPGAQSIRVLLGTNCS